MPNKETMATPVESFGPHLKKLFPFADDWLNINHGSYGSIPNDVLERKIQYQRDAEAYPDRFIRIEQPKLLDESREAVAKLLNAPLDTVVLVSNAIEGINTVLRNIKWGEAGHKDVLFTFSTVYVACGKSADFLQYYFGADVVEHRSIPLSYPVEDEDILAAFTAAVKQAQQEGKRARLCLFDAVSSQPGVVFPWVQMTKLCRELGVLSLADCAHSIGMAKVDLQAADPDFFISNCHKWLYAPRGCAVLYVPFRNQHLVSSSLATSHGFAPPVDGQVVSSAGGGNRFVHSFDFVGAKDMSPQFCVKDAVAWRRDVLGGEDRIASYLVDLNKRGSAHVAAALGTEVLNNSKGSMTDGPVANVGLDVYKGTGGGVVVKEEDWTTMLAWLKNIMVDEYKTWFFHFEMGARLWVRLSAQVYLGLDDYERAARVLAELTSRIGKRDYLQQ